jgi:thimet oligopeptidase
MRRVSIACAFAVLTAASACPSPGSKTVSKPSPTPTPAPIAEQPSPPVPPAPPKKSVADTIAEACKQHLDAARAAMARFTDGQKRDALATLGIFNDWSIEVDNAGSMAGLYAQVQPDPAARDAADKCSVDVQTYVSQVTLDRKIYDVLAAVDPKGIDADATRMLTLTLRDFRRSGVDKDEKTRARLQQINEEMTKTGLEFDKNIREDVRTVELDPKQLDGLPQDWIDGHKPNDEGKVVVNTDYPDYIPFRTYAKDSQARRDLFMAYMNRGWPKNDEVFKKLLALREEKATLLGYKNWAEYNAEDKMIKHADAIQAFIDKIAKASDAASKRDYKVLLDRKKKDDPKATFVDGTEYVYYENLVREEQYAFDAKEARKYFDFDKVEKGLLSVTGKLFGVEYRAVPDAPRWYDDVQVYDVYQDGQKIGRIYLDLHPREGKYKHAAQFTLVSGIDGRQLPEGALVCNFPKGLMEHDDVVTLFHEFGHLMHHVLAGRQKWSRFSGVATEWDFVEAPSQMLEEWAWDANVLQTFATDDSGQPIPVDLVKKMRAAKEFGKGYFVRVQMFYAGLSLRLHRIDDLKGLDTTKVVMEMQKKYSPFPYVKDTHFQASFGHLNGYSSGYYTYMWSLVIAKDMFSAFEKNGLMDDATAKKYRDSVLVPGGSKDAADLVKNFLGRPYGFESFKKWLDRT